MICAISSARNRFLSNSKKKKKKKKKKENNLFQFSLTSLKCFAFVICRHFTTLTWLKVLKLSKICLNMIKAMTPKNQNEHFGFSMNGYDSIYTVDLTSVVSDYKSLLVTTSD